MNRARQRHRIRSFAHRRDLASATGSTCRRRAKAFDAVPAGVPSAFVDVAREGASVPVDALDTADIARARVLV